MTCEARRKTLPMCLAVLGLLTSTNIRGETRTAAPGLVPPLCPTANELVQDPGLVLRLLEQNAALLGNYQLSWERVFRRGAMPKVAERIAQEGAADLDQSPIEAKNTKTLVESLSKPQGETSVWRLQFRKWDDFFGTKSTDRSGKMVETSRWFYDVESGYKEVYPELESVQIGGKSSVLLNSLYALPAVWILNEIHNQERRFETPAKFHLNGDSKGGLVSVDVQFGELKVLEIAIDYQSLQVKSVKQFSGSGAIMKELRYRYEALAPSDASPELRRLLASIPSTATAGEPTCDKWQFLSDWKALPPLDLRQAPDKTQHFEVPRGYEVMDVDFDPPVRFMTDDLLKGTEK